MVRSPWSMVIYLPLRGQAVARDQLHLLAKTIQLAKRSVDVGGDSKALKLLVNDGRDEDVMFVEQILANGLRIDSFDLNIRDGT